ncbi:MAG: hypothetical protein ACI4NA_00855 [Succinivibrio sp.]
MIGLFKRFFCLVLLLAALAVLPQHEGGSLVLAEAREAFLFCGGDRGAMDIAQSALVAMTSRGRADEAMESLGLLRIWDLAVLRLAVAWHAFGIMLPFLAAASWLGFRQLALGRIRAMSDAGLLRFALSKGRSLCLWALAFLLLEDSFASSPAAATAALALGMLIPGAASAAFACQRP